MRDRGPGIPEEERKRIFDMFYSVERGDRGRHGTGLGLAICRGMIGAHGGEVEALPGPDGRGTIMRITLPLDPATASRRMIDGHTQSPPTLQPARVLVIDDEPQIRKFLEISLRAQGYRCRTRGDRAGRTGRAGDCAARIWSCSTWGCRTATACEVLQEIRQWSQVPVIVLTVRSGEAEKVAALDAGANDYVTKPFGVQELMARVRACCDRTQPASGSSPVFDDGYLRVDLAAAKSDRRRSRRAVRARNTRCSRCCSSTAGRVVTQPQLLRELWGPTHQDDTHYLRSSSPSCGRSSATMPPRHGGSPQSRASACDSSMRPNCDSARLKSQRASASGRKRTWPP